jgi:DnaJ domain
MRPVVRAQLDYYSVLEIPLSADTAEVNAAFRRLAWRYHPDLNPAPGATLQFQDINEAHQVLSDPARRAEYDARWHRQAENARHARPPAASYHSRRRWHRHSHARSVLLTVFAMLFVSSAWAVIFAAMTAAHSGGLGYVYDAAAPILNGESSDCGFSMEMYPVNYVDQRGRVQTAWETEVHNCYGGGTRFSTLPQLTQRRATRFLNDPEAR